MNTRPPDDTPHTIGWHDSHCASVTMLSRTGRILYAAAEERFTGRKLQKGYPTRAIADMKSRFGEVSVAKCYADMSLVEKTARNLGLLWNTRKKCLNSEKTVGALIGTALSRIGRGRLDAVVGSEFDSSPARGAASKGIGYDALCEHHTAHAASAYFLSGFDRASVVTVDGVGDCLSGAVFDAGGGKLILRKKFYYNDLTVGADYETFTAMLGFNPDLHCGKITGLAAYGRRNDACIASLADFFEDSWRCGRRNYFDLLHGPESQGALDELLRLRETRFGNFSREDLACAMQRLAETRVLRLIQENVSDIPGTNIALAGGVFANVRINQKVKELGFRNIFIQPAMDDGGLSLGAALYEQSRAGNLKPYALEHMFVGPAFGEDEIQSSLDRSGIAYQRTEHLAGAVARLLAEGRVVARFDGAMEFGPRALGNRSILYETKDPAVNDWLNKRLGRSEFMPFAPVTLAEYGDECYERLEGARHAAEFMTITFDCTDQMKRTSPAVVHVDGTARPQLVTAETNAGLHEILDQYHRTTGIPSLVNTSFNMHEWPIVATPDDAIRSFQKGRLDYLAIGPFLARATSRPSQSKDAQRAQPTACTAV